MSPASAAGVLASLSPPSALTVLSHRLTVRLAAAPGGASGEHRHPSTAGNPSGAHASKQHSDGGQISDANVSFSPAPTRCCGCLVAQSCLILRPHGLQPARLPSPWDSPGKNTGVGCCFLLWEIFRTQGSNPCLLHWQVGSPDSNVCGQRLTVPPKPPPPDVSSGSHQCAWLAGAHRFLGCDSCILRSGPGLDLGPHRGPCRVGDIPSPVPGLSVISRGCWVPVSVCGWELSLLNEGNSGLSGESSPSASGLRPWLLLGGFSSFPTPAPPHPACRPGGRETRQLSHLAGKFTVLPEKACPGPLQSRTALEAGTINSAHYFLRASHPINNSFGW